MCIGRYIASIESHVGIYRTAEVRLIRTVCVGVPSIKLVCQSVILLSLRHCRSRRFPDAAQIGSRPEPLSIIHQRLVAAAVYILEYKIRTDVALLVEQYHVVKVVCLSARSSVVVVVSGVGSGCNYKPERSCCIVTRKF